jgi:multidrug efflux system outer membrane protein
MATDYGLRSLQLSLISQVATTYYLLLDYHQRLIIAQETLTSRLRSLDIIQQRFDRGILPEIDLNQAQIQKEIAAAAIPLYERSIAKTEHALSILLGRLPGEITQGTALNRQVIPPNIPAGLPAQLLERRPDVIQSLYLLNAQTARIGVATAMRLPAISLTGALGYASTEISSITSDGGVWSVGGSLLGPILDFGKGKQRVVIEEARTQQALYSYENTVLNALKEVEDALVEIETTSREIDAVTNKLKAARNAKRLSDERYDKGVTSYLEVLEADRTLFSVELEYSDLKQRYLSAYVTLYKSLGGGWISKEEVKRSQKN